MTIELLIELLKAEEVFLKTSQYGYMEISSGKIIETRSFDQEGSLDIFSNSKSDDIEQVVIKAYNGKKTIYIAVKDYDVIFVYDGKDFSISQLWTRSYERIERCPVDMEKVKSEILEHFSNIKNQKLAS